MLDTNAYTAYMRDDPSAVARVEASTRILLPAVVVGELMYGFRHGTRYRQYLEQLERFLAKPFGALLLTHDSHFDYVAGLAVVRPE